jgi:hypothetical protein
VAVLLARIGFNADPDPVYKINAVPDPIRTQPYYRVFLSYLKIVEFLTGGKNLIFFKSKIALDLSLGFHEGRPSDRRILQLSKENIQHFKTCYFFTFFYFYLNLLIPSPP